MKVLTVQPTIHRFDTVEEFWQEFQVGNTDLIITNEYICGAYLQNNPTGAQVLFQEKYGSGEPTVAMAEAMYADTKPGYKRVIAIGGGTVIDISKLFVLEQMVPVEPYFLKQKEPVKACKLIILPTTCGTGSEMTNISVVQKAAGETKMALTSDAIYADAAVLVPELLHTLPYAVFAASSLDALVHAIESGLSPKATEFSRLFGDNAIRMIVNGYRAIAQNSQNSRFELMGDFLTASCFAGVAFGNAGVAAVHALSYPLGVNFHVPHGEANYTLLLGVLRYYNRVCPQGRLVAFKEFLADLLGGSADNALENLEVLLERVLPHKSLSQYGVSREDITIFTDHVMVAQSRLFVNNYAPMERQDVFDIYMDLF